MVVGQSAVRVCLGLLVVAMLGACALPRSGPHYGEIADSNGPEGYGFHILPLTPDITRITKIDERSGFSMSFVNGAAEPVARAARGDVLAVTVWENADVGLLNPAGIGATPMPQSRVDERGRIYVPYVGMVRASGRTLGEIRDEIRDRLGGKTVDPQVDVFRVEANGRSISVQGVVKAPGIYPIDRPTTSILPMMARVGGVSIDAEAVRLKLRRGHVQGEIWLTDLYDHPENDVHLRTGDAIIAERDRRIFTALGAVGGNATVQFPTREVSLIRAIGTVGGLRDNLADPTGVFVFREEPVEIARRLLPGRSVDGPQRVVYVADLTQPAAMFLARDFKMRDRDTIYVTNAPFVRWMKILQAISPLVNFSSSVRTLGGL